MSLTDADLDHLADLARLELTPDERSALRDDLEILLGYVALLHEVDVAGELPMVRPPPAVDVLRDDVVTNRPDEGLVASLGRTRVEGRISVPRTLDDA